MKMILVPEWLESVLAANGKNLGALKNGQVLSTLSLRDLAFYSFLSGRFSDLLPSPIKEDWSVITDFPIPAEDSAVYYQSMREFTHTYSYEFSASKLVELCGTDCLGMSSDNSELKRDCVLGFDVLECIDDTFFVKAKEVDGIGLIQCYDQLFAILDKRYNVRELAAKATFGHYQSLLADHVVKGKIVNS